ncbi:MAG: AAA family ATPase [Pseudonocardia sp.]
MPFLSDRFHDQNRRDGRTDLTGPSGPPGSPAPANRTGAFDAAAVASAVGDRVVGQPGAVRALRRALVVTQAGFHDRERPLASMLLVGPTGVGKTEMVRRLAAQLRGGPDDLCRVDMGQLAQEHYAASLAGSPPGYAGSRESHSMFDRDTVEGTPYRPGIVLFDEIEKAHPVVLRALLGVLDRGVLTLANGERTISFRNAFVFLTSNLGSRDLARRRSRPWRRFVDAAAAAPVLGPPATRLAAGLRGRERGTVDGAGRDFFDPEFLNRLDEVVYFTEIAPDVAEAIVALQLRDVAAVFRRRGAELDVGPGVVEYLVRKGFDPVLGARGLARVVRASVVVPAAEALVRHRAGSVAGPGGSGSVAGPGGGAAANGDSGGLWVRVDVVDGAVAVAASEGPGPSVPA